MEAPVPQSADCDPGGSRNAMRRIRLARADVVGGAILKSGLISRLVIVALRIGDNANPSPVDRARYPQS